MEKLSTVTRQIQWVLSYFTGVTMLNFAPLEPLKRVLPNDLFFHKKAATQLENQQTVRIKM